MDNNQPMKLLAAEFEPFHASNPDFDILRFHFHDREQVAGLNLEGLDSAALLPKLAAYQRLLRMFPHEGAARSLLNAGYDSAHAVTLVSERKFVEQNQHDLAAGGGDGAETARQIHRNALAVRARASHLFANVLDMVGSRHFKATRFRNVDSGVDAYFKSLPSYTDLFGSLDYLECKHCSSILGPAAYFVDLMRIIDQYITDPSSGNDIPPGLHLEDRRPDLFNLPLDCANTDTPVPYLQIVNNVLEAVIEKQHPGDDAFRLLAASPFPFNLPFNLPLDALRLYVEKAGSALWRVYRTMTSPANSGTAEGGSSNTIVLAASASNSDGFYNGMEIVVADGTGVGQRRIIASYAGATRTATVETAWTTAPDATSKYYVTDVFAPLREYVALSAEQYDIITAALVFQAGTPCPSQPQPALQALSACYGVDNICEYLPFPGTGTVKYTKDTFSVQGVGTDFTKLALGDQILVGTAPNTALRTVVKVTSTTEAEVDTAWTTTESTGAAFTVYPYAGLDRVSNFLDRTGLTADQLKSLLVQELSTQELTDGVAERFFINDTGENLKAMEIVLDQQDSGNVFQRITNLSLNRLDRLNRFIRLARHFDWSYADLDWAMKSVGSETAITETTIDQLARIDRLHDETGVPVLVLCAFWFPLKTIGRTNAANPKDLFDRVFNNPALLNGNDPYAPGSKTPFDPYKDLPWVVAGRTEPDETIRKRLLAALAVNDNDLTLLADFLLAYENQPGAPPGTLILNLDSLSWLYRLSQAAAVLKLSIRDYLMLLAVLYYPLEPYTKPPAGALNPSVATVEEQYEVGRWLAKSPFTVNDLAYILTPWTPAAHDTGYTKESVRKLIQTQSKLADSIRITATSFVYENVTSDKSTEIYKHLVNTGVLSYYGILGDTQITYDFTATLYPLDKASFITKQIDATASAQTYDLLVEHQILLPETNPEIATLSESFNADTSLSFLFPDDPPNKDQMILEVQTILLLTKNDIGFTMTVLRNAENAQEAQAEDGVSGFFGVTVEMLVQLLDLAAETTTLAAYRQSLLDPLTDAQDVPQNVLELFDRIARTLVWVRKLEFTAFELQALATKPEAFNVKNPRALTFLNLESLSAFRSLVKRYQDRTNLLIRCYFRILDVKTCPGTGFQALSSLTGWNVSQIQALVNALWPLGDNPTQVGIYSTAGVLRMQSVFDLGALLGVDIYFLFNLYGLAMAPVSEESWPLYVSMEGQMLGALASKYPNPVEFQTVVVSLTKQLDTDKRNALLGYTLWLINSQYASIKNPSDLYGYLLMDVEMSSCDSTSYIQQGISSVQLYLQRCRMNMETGVTDLSGILPPWWEWMASYRLWEVNRKIFLYPENYLEPTLRSNRTPLYDTMVEEFVQSRITDASVSQAYTNYFQQLSILAGLVHVASYNCVRVAPDTGETEETLFLFARTTTSPYEYYYRERNRGHVWEPWIRLDVKINSAFVTPVFAFGRLFVFWTEINRTKSSSVSGTASTTETMVMATLKYVFPGVNGRWVQPQTVIESFPVQVLPPDYSPATDPTHAWMFDPSLLAWQQPFAFNLDRGLAGFGRVDLVNDVTSTVTGTGSIGISQVSTIVRGTTTQFTTQVRIGDYLRGAGENRRVVSIESDTVLTVDQVWSYTVPIVPYEILTMVGTVVGSTTAGSIQPQFLRQVKPKDRIWCAGQLGTVSLVTNGKLTLTSAWHALAQNAEYKIIPADPQTTRFPAFDGSGTIATSSQEQVVYGTLTKFTREVSVGDVLFGAGESRIVTSIVSDTQLVVNAAWSISITLVPYQIVPQARGEERIAVWFGPCTPTSTTNPPNPPTISNPGADPYLTALQAFDDNLWKTLRYARQVQLIGVTGVVTLGPAFLIDQDLAAFQTRLCIPNDQYSEKQDYKGYGGRFTRANAIVDAVQTPNSLAGNYWTDSAPGAPPSQTSATGTLGLLYHASDANGALFNVANQPGWFLFNNGNEAFLIASTESLLNRLSETVVAMPFPTAPEQTTSQMLSPTRYTENPIRFQDVLFGVTRLTTSAVAVLSRKLFAGGIPALLTLNSQLTPELPFDRFYQTPLKGPSPHLDSAKLPPPTLSFEGAFGIYYQEIFFYAPFLVADQLNLNARFDEARLWYQYIFDPTAESGPLDVHPNDRYWRYLPFRNLTLSTLESALLMPEAVARYNNDPFDPFAIAQLRPAAFPKAVVMKYIDNLLDWGDQLFTLDTRESINLAANMYVMAGDLLGPRPQNLGEFPPREPMTFAEIRDEYAAQGKPIPQFLIDLENTPFLVLNPEATPYVENPVNDINAYFCVPENKEFMAYWDRVEDRLFKIRHCMNIKGVERPLALFAPPLNPGDVIAQSISGGGTFDFGAAVDIPYYRFEAMIDKAKSLAGMVSQLGSALLGALEKRDAEALALLQNTQERTLLNLTTFIKETQVNQLLYINQSLQASLSSANARYAYYTDLVAKGLNRGEIQNLQALEAALVFNLLASVTRTAASIGSAAPNVGSPFAMTYGGVQIGAALTSASAVFEIGAAISSFIADRSLTMAGYERRSSDWQFQADLAGYDQQQVQAQIEANKLEIEIAKRDYTIHEKTVAQNEETLRFLREKFTNEELYLWLTRRISTIYFQAYSLAYEAALDAQRAYWFQADSDQVFLNYGYWDDLRKGLLAGDGLLLALNQMEKVYIDTNSRRLEIEKTVSLLALDPNALLELKNSGECMISLPEQLFDFDFPGHYCRKIATLSVSIPAVLGPYQNIHATLVQLSNQIITKPSISAVKFLLGDPSVPMPGPDTLRQNTWVGQEIALSTGVNDDGVFELSVNDGRYMPFENTGAVSLWKLSLPPATNRFDFAAISDVILNLRYSAIEGGSVFRNDVIRALPSYSAKQYYSFNQQFSENWFAFLNTPTIVAGNQQLAFAFPPSLIPPHVKPSTAKLLGFYFVLKTPVPYPGGTQSFITFQVAEGTAAVAVEFSGDYTFTKEYAEGDRPLLLDVIAGTRKIEFILSATPELMKTPAGDRLDPAAVLNIQLVLAVAGDLNWSSSTPKSIFSA